MRSLLLLALTLVACGPASTGPSTPTGNDGVILPDFSLEDRNPSSESFGQRISPRGRAGEVTAWYFSHVT